jgi:hypothetical protein
VTIGSVFNAGSTPAGSSGKFAIGEATTLGLLVQPLAVVGTGGIGDDAAAEGDADADAVLTGDTELATFLPLPGSVNSSTIPTMAMTPPADRPIAVRRFALARASARAAIRFSYRSRAI